jgi:hypothetical protein
LEAAVYAQIVKLKSTLADDEMRQLIEERAQQLRVVSGLLETYYGRDLDTGTLVGIYLWESKAAMRVFLETEAGRAASEGYRITEPPQTEVFKVFFTLRTGEDRPMPRPLALDEEEQTQPHEPDTDIDFQVRAIDDIPPAARTPNVDDDAEADADDADDDGIRGVETVESFSLAATSATRWRVAKSLLVLRDQVNQAVPNRSKASDGFIGDAAHASRNSDHNPWIRDGNVGVVTAFDITHDPAKGCDSGAIAEAIRGSRDARVKYIIWNRRIANSGPIGGNPAWAWRPYSGTNPHTKHVHISVKPDQASYDSSTEWAVF